MKTLENKANLPVVFLGAILLMVFVLTVTFWADDTWWISRDAGGRFVLQRDRVVTVNGCRLVYRGLQPPRHFRVDVTILALDPQSVYPHRIDKTAARRGFRLAGKNYRLVAARGSRLLLERSP
ncbi:MAG: hypothetical protein U5J82_08645 [Desulfobacterales bacterium]|nr:hypothetical protein [Desulfobacterales bacterium]